MIGAQKKLRLVTLCVALLALLSACSVSEQRQGTNGEKKVDIKTPFAEIHVGSDADTKDIGLASYPGAKPKSDSDSDKHSANISLGGENFGVRVATANFVTDDSPEKVIEFYRKELKRYGNVLECPKGLNENKSKEHSEITCSDSGSSEPGKLEMAVGVPEKQHVVSVKPNGKGTEFALVYVQVKGSDRGTL